MAISTEQGQRSVPLEQIEVPANVRQLDGEHVQALAAARALEFAEVPVVVCDAETEDADRAVGEHNVMPTHSARGR
jgi:hypothetical protein